GDVIALAVAFAGRDKFHDDRRLIGTGGQTAQTYPDDAVCATAVCPRWHGFIWERDIEGCALRSGVAVAEQQVSQFSVGITLTALRDGRHHEHSIDQLVAAALHKLRSVELTRRHQDASGIRSEHADLFRCSGGHDLTLLL